MVSEVELANALRHGALTLTLSVVVASQANVKTMDKDSARAQVGQSSRSIGITFSPAVELAFECALATVKRRSSATLITEQVVIELLDEETAAELLSSASVDVNALRADLKEHLGSDAGSTVEEPLPDEPLQNAMRRAVMAALTSNQKGANGADIILAILVDGDSYSAELLQKYGMTAASTENAEFERYLQRSKEQTKRLAEFQEKARSQRERTAETISINRSKPSSKGFKIIRNWAC